MTNTKYQIPNTKYQHGQVVILLLLVMLVALTIGLTITQRSLSDVSISSKTEQSSRAFSAAEAGIEKALLNQTATNSADIGNQSGYTVTVASNLPSTGQALEYPKLSKDSIEQYWLIDPNMALSALNLPATTNPSGYDGGTIDIYYEDPATPVGDLVALEVNLITKDNTGLYKKYQYLYDEDGGRRTNNNFIAPTACSTFTINTLYSPTISTLDRTFKCKITGFNIKPSSETSIALRIRLLYSSTSQPVAVAPAATKSLPPQVSLFTSVGTAGQTQKTVQVFKHVKDVPFFFDYAIYSVSQINKL